MATEREIYVLLGQAMADEAFRLFLSEDPIGAGSSLGICLTTEQAAALKATDLSQASEALDERLSRRPAD